MQTDNEKMLQEIVQNTEMGKNTLDELMVSSSMAVLSAKIAASVTRRPSSMLRSPSSSCRRA